MGGWKVVMMVLSGLIVGKFLIGIGQLASGLWGVVVAYRAATTAAGVFTAVASVKFVLLGLAVLAVITLIEDLIRLYTGQKSLIGKALGINPSGKTYTPEETDRYYRQMRIKHGVAREGDIEQEEKDKRLEQFKAYGAAPQWKPRQPMNETIKGLESWIPKEGPLLGPKYSGEQSQSINAHIQLDVTGMSEKAATEMAAKATENVFRKKIDHINREAIQDAAINQEI